MTTAIDTLTITRRLEASGFDRSQAEAVAEVFRETGQEAATRADLEALATKEELARMETRLYRALWIQTGAIVAAVAGLLALVERLAK